MLGWLRSLIAASPRRITAQPPPLRVRARYDAAQTPIGDAKHWANADTLSADASNSASVRQTLRTRARYEIANGGFAKRMIRVKANDLVGTGPRLQLLTGDEDSNHRLEAAWLTWMRKSRLARALRTAVKAKLGDGETLGLITRNTKLTTPAKIQLRIYECDRLTTPDLFAEQPGRIDGIDFDAEGNPATYWILEQHPGSAGRLTYTAKPYPAESVVHWYEEDRPEQHRGVPELTPSLRKFANHRRFEDATLDAAETAARIATVIHTNATPLEASAGVEAMDIIELERNAATVLPEGYALDQVKAEHPTTTFGDFSEHLITEEAAPLLMPYNVASGNSRKYNYASGRLDYQVYDFANDVERDDLEIVILEPVFEEWLRQTLAEFSGISPRDIALEAYPHEWHWDSRGHVDPQKEASAQDTRLKNGSTTYPREYAKAGLDWRNEFQTQAEALGLTLEAYQELLRQQLASNSGSQPADTADDEEPVPEDDALPPRKSRAAA